MVKTKKGCRMATLLNMLKNKNRTALRLLVKPPPIVVYCLNHHCATNMEIVFSKSKQNDKFDVNGWFRFLVDLVGLVDLVELVNKKN